MVNLFKLRLQTEYLRFLLKRNARYMFIMSVAMLTLYPILAITVKILAHSASYDGIREVGLFLNIALLLLTSFLIPLQVHGYMNSKKNLDVYHALPIRRQDLYLTSLIASILIIAGPFTVGWFSGGLLTMNATFNFMVILERYIVLLTIASATLSVVLFAMMNTGTSLDAFLYSVILNFLPLLAYGAYILFVQTILLGFTIGNLTKYITVIFPIWALFDNGFALKTGLWHSALVNAFYWLIVSGVILTVANQFYLRRKSEKAEKPFTNKTFFPIVSGLIIILFIIFMYCVIYSVNASANFTSSYYNPINFIFPIFFSSVLYLVMDAIAERGFKHLVKAFLNYLIIAVIALALLLGGLVTKGFGYASKIPALSDIQSIDLVYNDYSNLIIPDAQNTGNLVYDGAPASVTTLNLTLAQDIKTVRDLHQIILSEYKWIDYNYANTATSALITKIESQRGYTKSYVPLPFTISNMYSSISVNIRYHLKNGATMDRSYNIPIQWAGILKELNNSPEIIKLTAPNLANLTEFSDLSALAWNTPVSNTVISTSALNLNALKTAYLADLAALSDEQSLSTEYTALGYLSLTTCLSPTAGQCIASTIDVDARFPRVMALLSASGINLTPTADLSTINAALIIPNPALPAEDTNLIYKLALGQSSGKSVYELSSYANNGSTVNTYSYVLLSADQLKAILPCVAQRGYAAGPLMSLQLGNGVGGNLLVQAQYTDKVKAIIAGNEAKTASDLSLIFSGLPVVKK